MKNIAFFHTNGIAPECGGISRITSNLTFLFREKGNKVWYIGAKNNGEYEYDKAQVFLPNPELQSTENLEFFTKFINDHNIQTVINQGALSIQTSLFLEKAKQIINFKLISCIHNSILTPIKNYAYQKEYNLKSHHLGIIFKFLKTSIAKKILTQLYKHKHNILFKTIYDASDYVVGLSEGMRNEYLEITNFHSLTKYKTIPNFVTTSNLIINNSRTKTVLWVATVDIPVKRIDYMLDAWSRICDRFPDWQLNILGDGPQLQTAKYIASNLNLKNVNFIGRVDPKNYYTSAEILCVTSSHEAFPMVLLEALQYGVVPIVNNSFHTASEILANGKYGLLAKPFDLNDFTNQLSNLISNDLLRKQLQNQSKSALRKYSPNTIYALWQSII